SRNGLPSHPLWRMLLLPQTNLRSMRTLQKSWDDGGIWGGGRGWVCGVHQGDGLDCGGRDQDCGVGEGAGGYPVRAGGVDRAGEYVLQGGEAAGSAAG